MSGVMLTLTAPGARRVRSLAVDGLRGLAVLAMVVDHLALLSGGPWWLRWTVGRLAMPLFFWISGHLVARLSWRHLWVAGLGVLLPIAAPWVDSPNVLVLYALGAVVVVLARRRWGLAGLVGACLAALALAANGIGPLPGSYPFPVLLALMVLGALTPQLVFERWGCWAPRWLSWVGRYPLSVYVGHVLLLTVLFGRLP